MPCHMDQRLDELLDHLRSPESCPEHERHLAFDCVRSLAYTRDSDTLRRHRELHVRGTPDSSPRISKACDQCHSSKTRCNGGQPCNSCSRRRVACTSIRQSKRNPTDGNTIVPVEDNGSAMAQDSLLPNSTSTPTLGSDAPRIPGQSAAIQDLIVEYEQYLRREGLSIFLNHASERSSEDALNYPAGRNPSLNTCNEGERDNQFPLDKDYYVGIYFAHFQPQWPILHQNSFRSDQEPHVLVLTLVTIGLWITGEETARLKATKMHGKLLTLLEAHIDDWKLQGEAENNSWPMCTYQAILLNIVFAMIREARELYSRCHSMLRTLTMTCRAAGMFSYQRMLAQGTSDEPVLFSWIRVEEIKRFALALFKLNMLVGTEQLGPSDLQFPLPDNGYLWDAPGSGEWYRRFNENMESSDSEAKFICDIFSDIQAGREGIGVCLHSDNWLGFLASLSGRKTSI
ncbi:hypothetical protein BBP40_004131 [Aspergillus hancockii]|nr:hypothetical protein BBP40_004131 [Aspergillus hancockii]